MSPLAAILAVAVGGYLIGSIPWAVIVGRVFWRVDIRTLGSGNTGATNVARVFGPVPGVSVLFLDGLKGAAAVTLATALSPQLWGAAGVDWLQVLAAMTSIAGHSFSPFIRFQGGKGVATAAGALLVMAPKVWPVMVLLFLVTVLASKMVSLGSVVIAAVFPVVCVLAYPDRIALLAFSVIATTLVLWRHRTNIARIARGEEAKITFKRRMWDEMRTKDGEES